MVRGGGAELAAGYMYLSGFWALFLNVLSLFFFWFDSEQQEGWQDVHPGQARGVC